MFRKLVSNLPYSPALVGQLGFYARRLRQEEATRRLGLVFTALALVVQSLAVFSPPDAANAANPSDMIYGGITTKEQLLTAYDNSARGNGDLKQIYDYAGITRDELATAKEGTINSREKGTGTGTWLTWGRMHRFSAAQGETKHTVDASTTVYSRPLWLFNTSSYTKKNGSTHRAFIGYSEKMGEFAVLKECGNLVTTKLPVTPAPVPPPVPPAESRCSLIQLKRIDRTRYTLEATAWVTNDAQIKSYVFDVKDSAGSVVYSETIQSSNSSTESSVIEISTPGDYVASVAVNTSVGIRTSSGCTTPLSVSPAEKCALNSSLLVSDSECQPCPENDSYWYKAPECAAKVASGKSGINLTRGNSNAESVKANASDRIEYRLSVENVGQIPAVASIKEELADVLEYATIHDNGGASFDDESKVLSWGDVVLQPGESQTRSFVVSVLGNLPTTSRGISDQSSYDCIMTNAFGNTVNIGINCDTPKKIESIVADLPKTGPGENMLFAGVLGSVVTYFYARSRQLRKEVRLIRKEFNMGTL